MADKKKPESGKRKAEAAEKKAPPKAAARKPAEKKASAKPAAPSPTRIEYTPRQARAFQRSTRQSPYKMRLVIDQIRGKSVNEALALLAFSKKHAAKQIEKVVKSAVANAEYAARNENASLDVDDLVIKHSVINEGIKMKRDRKRHV